MNGASLRFTRPTTADLPALERLCAGRILGTEIYTALQTDGENSELLWVGRDGRDRPRCILCDCGSYKLWLTRFRSAVGRHDAGAASIFSPPRRGSRYLVMKKTGPAAVPRRAATELTGAKLREMYVMFSGGRGKTEALEKYYVSALRRANRELGLVYGILENGRLVSGAQILAENRDYALIGNVFTEKDRRNNGLASDALAACEQRCASRGKIPVLYCKKEMAGFYRRRGYKRVFSL